MELGLAILLTDYSIQPARLGALAEERNFESLFLAEHTHIPTSRDTPYPGGAELPREYSHTVDPFVGLSAAATVTERLKVGTGVCLVTERDPIVTAKEVATLDLISEGRFLFGVGAGWNEEEMRNHGTNPRRRFSLMRERVEAMQRIWAEEEASYSGEFVAFERIWAWPKPTQTPLPVLVGGNGPKVIDRVLAYGDEWLPEPEDGLPERMLELRRRAEEAGREVPITVYGVKPEEVDLYAEAGAHRVVHWLPPRGPEDTRRRVDELAAGIL